MELPADEYFGDVCYKAGCPIMALTLIAVGAIILFLLLFWAYLKLSGKTAKRFDEEVEE
jgi:hypothetical protein